MFQAGRTAMSENNFDKTWEYNRDETGKSM
jgi:hypothetical protein